MSAVDIICIACIGWGIVAAVSALGAFRNGHRFLQFVKKESALDRNTAIAQASKNRIAVILPCKGVDEKLRSTIDAIQSQSVTPTAIIFTLESQNDSAYAALKVWTADWKNPTPQFVIAGITDHRGQKIHNLLAAVDALDNSIETIVFVDSDAVPGNDWLAYLVAPLRDLEIGASTGYRWYTAIGGLAAGMRTAWNAATVTVLANESRNFAWGGSTAIRRTDFFDLGIADAWQDALSDDLVLTQCLRKANRRIHFVPQAMVASADQTTLAGFLDFATRQMIITRICAPSTWRSGLWLVMNLTLGGTAVAIVTIGWLAGWFDNATYGCIAAVIWAAIMIGVAGEAINRQLALRRLLSPPDRGWRDVVWDIGGTLTFGGSLHTHLFVKSMFRRSFWWRNTLYHMPSASETHILDRR